MDMRETLGILPLATIDLKATFEGAESGNAPDGKRKMKDEKDESTTENRRGREGLSMPVAVLMGMGFVGLGLMTVAVALGEGLNSGAKELRRGMNSVGRDHRCGLREAAKELRVLSNGITWNLAARP